MHAPQQADQPTQPRRPKGRPKLEDLAALEARLISEGSQLFFKHGYGATTMSDVAALARVSKTTLYSRFPSKAALFRAIVARQVESWDTGPNHTPLVGCDTLEKTLSAYGAILWRAGTTTDFKEVYRLLFSESNRFPELGDIASARFERGVESLSQLIREFAERDSIPCRDPRSAAELFLAMIAGWINLTIASNRNPQSEQRRAWLDTAVRTFMASRSSW